METAATIFAVWSAAIFAVIEAVEHTPVGQTSTWARVLPVLPLVVGGVTGPTVVPIAAEHLPWLTDVDTWGAAFLGIGAGAVAASGHGVGKQAISGRDERIRGRKMDLTDALER